MARSTYDIDRVQTSDGANQPPIIDRADWVCLKLFAGGIQDLADVAQLRAVVGPALDHEVTHRLPTVPRALRQAWTRVTALRD